MKIDFDTFEFAGLIAPGSLLVLALVLLMPQLLHASDSAVLIGLGLLLASYILGHLVAAIANIAEPLFRLAGIYQLESLTENQWVAQGLLADDQRERFKELLTSKLQRHPALGLAGSTKRKTVVKQIYLMVVREPVHRISTLDGLYNLSRGLFVSFIICALLAVAERQYSAGGLCLFAAGLTLYRARKFKRLYSRELIQHFLLPQDHGSPTGPATPSSAPSVPPETMPLDEKES